MQLVRVSERLLVPINLVYTLVCGLDELRGSNEFICAPAIKFPLLFLMNFTFDSESFLKSCSFVFQGLPLLLLYNSCQNKDYPYREFGHFFKTFAFRARETLPFPLSRHFRGRVASHPSWASKEDKIGSPG